MRRLKPGDYVEIMEAPWCFASKNLRGIGKILIAEERGENAFVELLEGNQRRSCQWLCNLSEEEIKRKGVFLERKTCPFKKRAENECGIKIYMEVDSERLAVLLL